MLARTAVAVLSLLAAGCGPAPEQTRAPDWPADEAEIRGALQSSADAWNRGDLKGHLAFYVPDVTFMTASGPRPGVEAIEKAFREKYFVDGAPRQQLRFEQVMLRRLGPDFALATGRYVLQGGGEAEHAGWFTTIWTRTPAGWRSIHDHSS
jgi:beta-aspartyl-peptidase (threonine type)